MGVRIRYDRKGTRGSGRKSVSGNPLEETILTPGTSVFQLHEGISNTQRRGGLGKRKTKRAFKKKDSRLGKNRREENEALKWPKSFQKSRRLFFVEARSTEP